jgi:hypothetical protein
VASGPFSFGRSNGGAYATGSIGERTCDGVGSPVFVGTTLLLVGQACCRLNSPPYALPISLGKQVLGSFRNFLRG